MSVVEAPAITNPRARRRMLLRKRFLRRPMAVAGLVVVLVFVVTAIFAPLLAPYGAGATDFNSLLTHSSSKHLLGTDELGRDELSRIIWGARASMQAGFFATVLAMVVAVPIGMVAGYYRGWIDTVIARITDVLLAFPFLILAVGLAAILGPSLLNATIALGVGGDAGLDPDRPRRDARAARGGLRAGRRRERRERLHDHLPPHPPEHDEHVARAGDGHRFPARSSARRCCRSSGSACSRRRRRGA